MRQNLPVTQRAYPLGEDDILMSVTDKDSYIRYCNAKFIEVSGFTREELLGEPHNLVRHPDMPPAAFADMWETMKSGNSWTGAVKNRRKDGDHYWVRANATPIMRDGEITGYMSVRTTLTGAEIESAESLYRKMRQNQLRWQKLKRGLLVYSGPLAFLSWGKRMSLRVRTSLVFLLLTIASCAAFTQLDLSVQALTNVSAIVALAFLTAFVMLDKQIVTPLKRILTQANKVSSGQMKESIDLHRVDELGMLMRAVNQSGLNARSLLDDVSLQISRLQQSSESLTQGTATLGQHTFKTAESLQSTAAALVETSQSLEQNANNARELATRSNNTSTLANESRLTFDDLRQKMDAIQSSSNKISNIIGMIDDVAFQTNILALNAAVEAARAGEQGRGFAVVASEVRQLAGRSTDAAADVKSLIDNSTRGIQEGTNLASRAGDVSDSIREQFDSVASLIENISQSIIEQSTAVAEISAALESVDSMTASNNALVQENGESSKSLMRQARILSSAVAAYRGDTVNIDTQLSRPTRATRHSDNPDMPDDLPRAA